MEIDQQEPVTAAPTGFTRQRIVRAGLIGGLLFVVWSYALAPWMGRTSQPQASDVLAPAAAQSAVSEFDQDNEQGYAQARRDHIASHADCRKLVNSFMISGCQRYVTEQKHIPPAPPQAAYNSGKSTATCVAEVNAHWEPLIQDLRERGDEYAADTASRTDWDPELQNCQNYDHVRIGKVIHEPAARLREMMKKLEDGGKATDEDVATVRRDLPGVESFPDNQYRAAYLQEARYFLDIAEGKAKPPEKIKIKLSCNKLQEKIRQLLQSEEDMIREQRQLNRSSPAENQRWEALNKARIHWLGDWKRYTDTANASGCSYPDSL